MPNLYIYTRCLLLVFMAHLMRFIAAEHAISKIFGLSRQQVHLYHFNSQKSCFASMHACGKPKQCNGSKVISNRYPDSINKSKVNFILKSTEQSDDHVIPPSHKATGLLFLVTYIIVPLFTSSILNIENDSYQFSKQQFDAAMLTGFDPQISTPDSAEYIAMSYLYNESMQSLFVLLLSKRLALYFIATVATLFAGWRSYEGIYAIKAGRSSGPGEALDRLNREILDGEPFDLVRTDENGSDDEKNIFATLVDQNEQVSNDAGKNVALGLPFALTASLAFSYGVVVVGKTSTGASDVIGNNYFSEIQNWISTHVPYLASLPSFILCLLFLSAEFRRVFPRKDILAQSGPSVAKKEPLLCAGNVLAFIYVIAAYLAKVYPTITLNELTTIPISLDLWPLQNGVNVALATTVTRALGPFLVPLSSPKSIRTTALALVGVAIFDGISVFGTVANAAIENAPDASIMEAVARSKLASQSSNMATLWQPGLLEIIIGHNSNDVTEALGLGDVVFPACLVAWALNADEVYSSTAQGESPKVSYEYTFAATFGYIVASLAMEVIGSFSLLGNRGGLPALVFLVPTMLVCVTVVAWRKKELSEVWGFRS